jgi:hypothetical protein
MKVVGLDQKEYSINIVKYNRQLDGCSSLHLRARKLLALLFPYENIYEEVVLPGIKTEINNKSLVIDFYIHFQRIAVEVQGQQHSQYTPFFHTNKLEFFRAKRLDSLKRKWCTINNILLVELLYNESDSDWENRIRNR